MGLSEIKQRVLTLDLTQLLVGEVAQGLVPTLEHGFQQGETKEHSRDKKTTVNVTVLTLPSDGGGGGGVEERNRSIQLVKFRL